MSFGVIPPSDAAGQQHVAFGAGPDQLDEWRELLHQHGIGIESDLDWPEGGQSLYFRGPDDHRLLPLEAVQPVGVGNKRLRDHLQRHVPVELGIAGLIHVATSAHYFV